MHVNGSAKVNDAVNMEISLLRRELKRKLEFVSFDSQVAPLLDAAQAPTDALAARIESVAQDPDLSHGGKAKQLRAGRLDSLAKLAKFESDELLTRTKGLAKVILDFERQVDEAANAKLARPKDPTERLIAELRYSEIRRSLPADQLARDLAYLSTSDPEVIAAFETAPVMFTTDGAGNLRPAPYVSPERVRERVLTRAHELAPADTVGALKELYFVRDTLQGLVASARAAIDEAIPAAQ